MHCTVAVLSVYTRLSCLALPTMPMGELGELYGAAYIGVCVSMV